MEKIVIGSIVKDKDYARNWVALNVTDQDIEQGVLTETPGIYLFAGMWYGDDAMDRKSFGKMIEYDSDDCKVIGHAANHTTKELLIILN